MVSGEGRLIRGEETQYWQNYDDDGGDMSAQVFISSVPTGPLALQYLLKLTLFYQYRRG